MGKEEDTKLKQSIGHTIRRLRKKSNWRVYDLASESGVSEAMLSRIENGQISPSLATLSSIAEALNTPISGLFRDFEQQREVTFVKAGDGLPIQRGNSDVSRYIYQMLGHSHGDTYTVVPYLVTLTDEYYQLPLVEHDGIEVVYIIKGEVTYLIGDKSYNMKKGDILHFESGVLHGPETVVEFPTQMLVTIVSSRN